MAKKKKKSTKKSVSKKKQIAQENKLLRNLFLGLAGFVLVLLIIWAIFYSINNFEYRDVKFKIVKFCDSKPCLILYNTKLPIIYQGKKEHYDFYLRNDPRKLEDIPFNGELYIRPQMVVNVSGFQCEGDGAIAIANFVNLQKLLGTQMIKDPNVSCDEEKRYVYINIQESNETSIEQIAPACYNLNVNNCEILKVTERFMLETFVEVNKLI